jgi:hypothetical protein
MRIVGQIASNPRGDVVADFKKEVAFRRPLAKVLTVAVD